MRRPVIVSIDAHTHGAKSAEESASVSFVLRVQTLHFPRNRQERGGLPGLEISRRGDMTPLWDPRWNPIWDAVGASGLPARVHTIAASPSCFCSYLQRNTSHRFASSSHPAPVGEASRRLHRHLGAERR
jgi:hypothetical protein